MFICDITKKSIGPGKKLFKLVVKTRPREYFEDREVIDENTGRKSIVNIKVAEGFEIVHELNVCEEVYRKYTNAT